MEYRLVMLGPGGCGKSAITIRYVSGNFVGKYDPTIEDSYRKQVEIDQQALVLDILDTAGQDEYSALRDQYTKTGDGFVLVFGLNRAETLQRMNAFYIQIKRSTQMRRPPVLLVGNKSDLAEERQVKREDALHIAKNVILAEYLETSAKTGANIQNVYESIVRMVQKHRQTLPVQPTRRVKCTII